MGVRGPPGLIYPPLQNNAMVANLSRAGSARVLRIAARKPPWSVGSRAIVMQGSAVEAMLFQQLQQTFLVEHRNLQLLGLRQL